MMTCFAVCLGQPHGAGRRCNRGHALPVKDISQADLFSTNVRGERALGKQRDGWMRWKKYHRQTCPFPTLALLH